MRRWPSSVRIRCEHLPDHLHPRHARGGRLVERPYVDPFEDDADLSDDMDPRVACSLENPESCEACD